MIYVLLLLFFDMRYQVMLVKFKNLNQATHVYYIATKEHFKKNLDFQGALSIKRFLIYIVKITRYTYRKHHYTKVRIYYNTLHLKSL